MNVLRAILGLLALGLAAWFLVAVFGSGDEGKAAPAMSFASSQECRDCHPDVYAEWEGSPHANSWVNPAVRALSNDFATEDCIACHAPRSVFAVGIGERMLPRATRRPEGVDCITCHELPEADGGGVAGTINDPRAACRPVEKIELTRPSFCAGCHNQHKTVDQWRESDWPEKGMDCLTCHMPHRDNDPNLGRSHSMPGGTSLDYLQRAVELSGERSQAGWTITLANVGAGHAYPTDERSRASDLFWRPLPGESGDSQTWRHLHRIRDPYRTETEIPSTLLHSGEVRTIELEPADAAEAEGKVEVALFYKRSPYWEVPEAPDPDREAVLVHRIVLEP